MISWIKRQVSGLYLSSREPLSNVIVLMVIVTIFYLLHNSLGYEHFLELSKIWAWPLFLLLIALRFRRVIAYLFFSLEEFGFFGTKGRLKDVRALIEEKVSQRLTEEREKAERAKEIEVLKNGFNKSNDNNESLLKFGQNAIIKLEEYSEELQKKDKRIEELEKINNNLVNNVRVDSYEADQPRVGTLVNKDGIVYLVGDNGLHGIPSLDAFNSWEYSFSQVHPINSVERFLPEVEAIPSKLDGFSNPLEQIRASSLLKK